MPAPLKTKEEIQAILVDLFSRFGFDGVSLSLIARETGLDRGSLYHYYPGGKKQMASSALESKVSALAGDVLRHLEGGEGSPRSSLESFFRALGEFYTHGRSYCLVGVFPTGSATGTFSDSLNAAYAAWVGSLTPVLEAHGQDQPREQAISFLSAVQGALILEKIGTGDPPFDTTLRDFAQRWGIEIG